MSAVIAGEPSLFDQPPPEFRFPFVGDFESRANRVRFQLDVLRYWLRTEDDNEDEDDCDSKRRPLIARFADVLEELVKDYVDTQHRPFWCYHCYVSSSHKTLYFCRCRIAKYCSLECANHNWRDYHRRVCLVPSSIEDDSNSEHSYSPIPPSSSVISQTLRETHMRIEQEDLSSLTEGLEHNGFLHCETGLRLTRMRKVFFEESINMPDFAALFDALPTDSLLINRPGSIIDEVEESMMLDPNVTDEEIESRRSMKKQQRVMAAAQAFEQCLSDESTKKPDMVALILRLRKFIIASFISLDGITLCLSQRIFWSIPGILELLIRDEDFPLSLSHAVRLTETVVSLVTSTEERNHEILLKRSTMRVFRPVARLTNYPMFAWLVIWMTMIRFGAVTMDGLGSLFALCSFDVSVLDEYLVDLDGRQSTDPLRNNPDYPPFPILGAATMHSMLISERTDPSIRSEFISENNRHRNTVLVKMCFWKATNLYCKRRVLVDVCGMLGFRVAGLSALFVTGILSSFDALGQLRTPQQLCALFTTLVPSLAKWNEEHQSSKVDDSRLDNNINNDLKTKKKSKPRKVKNKACLLDFATHNEFGRLSVSKERMLRKSGTMDISRRQLEFAASLLNKGLMDSMLAQLYSIVAWQRPHPDLIPPVIPVFTMFKTVLSVPILVYRHCGLNWTDEYKARLLWRLIEFARRRTNEMPRMVNGGNDNDNDNQQQSAASLRTSRMMYKATGDILDIAVTWIMNEQSMHSCYHIGESDISQRWDRHGRRLWLEYLRIMDQMSQMDTKCQSTHTRITLNKDDIHHSPLIEKNTRMDDDGIAESMSDDKSSNDTTITENQSPSFEMCVECDDFTRMFNGDLMSEDVAFARWFVAFHNKHEMGPKLVDHLPSVFRAGNPDVVWEPGKISWLLYLAVLVDCSMVEPFVHSRV